MSSIYCMFCGGSSCKYENYQNWINDPKHPNAIEGLFSNWIGGNILATQRPSTNIIKKYDLINEFKKHNLLSIINLEEFGEHPNCGDGIDPSSGFSYKPEDFMNEGIFYYNFGWEDLKTPTYQQMLNIVQVLTFSLENDKKTAVHCHAGLGRTGLVIACYFIYNLGYNAEKAILTVRNSRPLSIQTKKQQLFIYQFEEYIEPLKIIYPGFEYKTNNSTFDLIDFSLNDLLERQRIYYHGPELRKIKYIPIIILKIIERLKASLLNTNIDEFYNSIYEFNYNITENNEEYIKIQKEINKGNWDYINNCNKIKNLVELLFLWILKLNNPLIPEKDIKHLMDSENKDYLSIIKNLSKETFYIFNYILDLFRDDNIPIQNLNKKIYKAIVLLTASHSILLKNSEYSINIITDILKEENKDEYESKFNKCLDSFDYLDYDKILSLQNKIIDFLIFLQYNYRVGIDNIPVYNKTKINEKPLINPFSKSNKRKLKKSKSESIIKCKKSHLMDTYHKPLYTKNENIEMRKEREYCRSDIIPIQEIENTYENEKKVQSLKDLEMDINDVENNGDHSIRKMQYNEIKNDNSINVGNVDMKSVSDNKTNSNIKDNINLLYNNINESDNKYIINDNNYTSNIKTDKISITNEKSIIDNENKSMDNTDNLLINDDNKNDYNYKISNINDTFTNKENNSSDIQNNNVILKKENNKEYILLNLNGNEIECISSNESFINDNKNTSESSTISIVEENKKDIIQQTNISNLNKEIKYSNKYLKTKSSETLSENTININNNEVSIKITTLPINHKQIESLSEECNYDNLSSDSMSCTSENRLGEIKQQCNLFESDTKILNKVDSYYISNNDNHNYNKLVSNYSENNNTEKKLKPPYKCSSIDDTLLILSTNENNQYHNNENKSQSLNKKLNLSMNKSESVSSINESMVKSSSKSSIDDSSLSLLKSESSSSIPESNISMIKSVSSSSVHESNISMIKSISSSSVHESHVSILKSESDSSINVSNSTLINSEMKNPINEKEQTYERIESNTVSSNISDKEEDHGSSCDKESELSSLEWNISDISDETNNHVSQAKSDNSTKEEKASDNILNTSTMLLEENENENDENLKNLDTNNDDNHFPEIVAEKALSSYKMGNSVSVGFNSINNTDEIDVKENIYTRDYWTDILLFIDILISSGSFEPEISKLLRKLTLERNLAIYIIYTNCSEEDNEGNVTLYKKFIDTVNIFCKKVMKMPSPVESEIPNGNNSLTSKRNNDNIDIFNCEDDCYEEGNYLNFIIPSKKFTNNHKLESKNPKLFNSKSYIKKRNLRKSKYMTLNKNNDNPEPNNLYVNDVDSKDKMKNKNDNYYNSSNNNFIDLENYENEETDNFEFANQKENQNQLKETNNINNKSYENLKDFSSMGKMEYIINENDFFKPSKISIDNIPSTLKLSTIKNKKTDTNILELSSSKTLDKNDLKNAIKSNNLDCFVKELSDENEEIIELIPSEKNKRNMRKHKYLKKTK